MDDPIRAKLLKADEEARTSTAPEGRPAVSFVVAAALVTLLVAANLSSTCVANSLLAPSATAGAGGGRRAAVSPLFMGYFCVSWGMVCFAFLGALRLRCCARRRQQGQAGPEPQEPQEQQLQQQLSAEGRYAWRYVARRSAWLCLVYQLGNVLYFVGLQRMSVSVALIFHQSSSAFVLLLSAALLPGYPEARFRWRRAAAVAVCLLGVGLVALDNWSRGETTVASMGAMLASSVLWALYEVLLKRWLGAARVADSFRFVGWRAAVNAALGWPLLLGAAARWPAAGVWPAAEGAAAQRELWGGLLALAAISVALTLLYTLGIALTSPVFVHVGTMLTVPASVLLLDVAWRGERPGWPRLLGAAYVGMGFALLDDGGAGEGGDGGGSGSSSVPRGPCGARRRPAARDVALALVLAGGVAAVATCAAGY